MFGRDGTLPKVDISGLHDADQSIDLSAYTSELWGRRDYIRYVAESQLRSQQMNTVLGNLWHLLNPALQIGVFYLIFGVILKVDRGVPNLIAFMTVGLFVYQLSVKTITSGANSIVGSRPLLKSIWFPRALLPVTSSVTELLAFIPMLAIMLAVTVSTGEPLLWSWIAIPAILLLQTVLNVGLALIAARAANHVGDIQQLLPFIFRLLLYASGVLFLVDAYVEESRYRILFDLNPFYGIVSMWRWAVLDYAIDPLVVWLTVVVSLSSLVAGIWWFRRGEQGYTDAQ